MFKNRFQEFLGFFILITLPFGVYAQDVLIPLGSGGPSNIWTVYAFGNGQAIYDTLKAISHFIQTDLFRSVASLVAVSGAVVLALKSGATVEVGRKFIGYAFLVMMFTYVFFGWGSQGKLTINLAVYEVDTGYQFAPLTVPAAVGIPASVISTAGREMTRAIESSFSGVGSGAGGLQEALKMSNGAPFNLAASLAQDATKARIVDPYFNNSLAYYTQDCLTIGIAGGYINASTMASTDDFLLAIGGMDASNSPVTGGLWAAGLSVMTFLSNTPVTTSGNGGGVNVTTPVPMGELTSCKNAWERLRFYVNSKDILGLLTGTSAWSSTPAAETVTAGFDGFYSQIAGTTGAGSSATGASASQSKIRQAAMLNAYSGVQSTVAAATGNSELLTALSLEQAKQNQYNSWVTGAEVFNRMMGYILALLQVFVYAAMPMVLVLALIPGLGGKLFVNFSQILLWLAIVQPLLAIVNFIILSMQSNELGGMFGGTSGGVSLSSLGIVSEKTANLRAAGSFIGTMVPALAWGLVKGGMDFSKLIAAGVGEQFASTAATTMTTGNYSLNAASIDTFSANKKSIAGNSVLGNGFSMQNGVGELGTDSTGIDPKAMQGGAYMNAATNLANTTALQNTTAKNIAAQEQVNLSRAISSGVSNNGSMTASGASAVAEQAVLSLSAGTKSSSAGPASTGSPGIPTDGGKSGETGAPDFKALKSVVTESPRQQTTEQKAYMAALDKAQDVHAKKDATLQDKSSSMEMVKNAAAGLNLAGTAAPPAPLAANASAEATKKHQDAQKTYLQNKMSAGSLLKAAASRVNASLTASGTGSRTLSTTVVDGITTTGSQQDNGSIGGGVTGSSSEARNATTASTSSNSLGGSTTHHSQNAAWAQNIARQEAYRASFDSGVTDGWNSTPGRVPGYEPSSPKDLSERLNTGISNLNAKANLFSSVVTQDIGSKAERTDAAMAKLGGQLADSMEASYAKVAASHNATDPENFPKAFMGALNTSAGAVWGLAQSGGAAALETLGLDPSVLKSYAQALRTGLFDKAAAIAGGTDSQRSAAIASLGSFTSTPERDAETIKIHGGDLRGASITADKNSPLSAFGMKAENFVNNVRNVGDSNSAKKVFKNFFDPN